ncbi:hypothetical protein Q8G81_33975, partial [Klebsiella pneumoniae]
MISGKLEQSFHTVLIPDAEEMGHLRLYRDTSYRSLYLIHQQINNLRDTWLAQEGVSSDLFYNERRKLK